MPTASTVLILGARGRFGSAAVQAFSRAGWRVLAQVRPGTGGLPAQPGVEWVRAHPADTQVLAAAAAGAAVVVQGLSPAYTHAAWRRDLPGLTQAAIGVTRALGATLMLPASVYNFGAGMPAQLHEDTAQAATTFKGRMRIASERQIEVATQDGRMKAVVIRGGDFFGSGTGSWLDMVIAKSLRTGVMTYPGALDVPTAWAYLPDMARAFVAVAQRRERLPAFEMLHFAGETLAGADWAYALQAVAREQGWITADEHLRVRQVPWPLMRVAGVFVPTLRALCEMRYLWRTPHALVDTRMATLTGPLRRTPFEQALRQSLLELGLIQDKPRAVVPALS